MGGGGRFDMGVDAFMLVISVEGFFNVCIDFNRCMWVVVCMLEVEFGVVCISLSLGLHRCVDPPWA
jgi:hypothetical protein